MKTKSFAKKRLMYIQTEDYNFLTYNLLILLHTLKCDSFETRFRDFRKIAYLIAFINSGGEINNYNQDELANIYSKAQLKKQLLSHLLVVLQNHNYIGVSINSTHNSFDLWITLDQIPQEFFDKKLFKKEINNINTLKGYAYSLKTVPVKKLVDEIFTSRNVLTWEI